MVLPLHAAVNMYAVVNMHVGAVSCKGHSDDDGHAAFTTYLAFHFTFHCQVIPNLVGLCTSVRYFACFSLHTAAPHIS